MLWGVFGETFDGLILERGELAALGVELRVALLQARAAERGAAGHVALRGQRGLQVGAVLALPDAVAGAASLRLLLPRQRGLHRALLAGQLELLEPELRVALLHRRAPERRRALPIARLL